MKAETPIREASKRFFSANDGTRIFYRHWAGQKTDRAFVLLHRGHEHSGRLQHLVDELNYPDYPMFAWDARGHGESPGERGYSPSFATSVNDLDVFIRHISQSYGIAIENITVIAQSVGAVLAATWAHDYAPRIRALVLASPAFKVKLYVPFARPGLRFLTHFKPLFFVNSYVKAKFLTHDPERIQSYEKDPLITRPIAVNILLGLYEAAERIVSDAGAITLPTQLLISGSDWVVHHKPQHQFFDNLGSQDKEKHVLEGFYHDTLGEKDRHFAIQAIRQFVERQYAKPAKIYSRLDAHKLGFTYNEYLTLSTPLPWWSPKNIAFACSRLYLKTLGKLSTGIRIGNNTGYDSGTTLDYVYRNKPAGITPLGKFSDFVYLNAIGWRGIRQRKLHAEAMLLSAAQRLKAAGKAVQMLDVAAGHGRYVLDAIQQMQKSGIEPQHVVLRDYSPMNVLAGTNLIAARQLSKVAQFKQGDAFNTDSLAQEKATLAIVSGLYELFANNDQIRQSLQGLAKAIPEGGYLVYTNQPWHPQLEFIARVLTSHREGQDWVMRRRTQDEMDQLVAAAGFQKIDMRIDEWGIFSVSLAIRVAH